jgi:hypothetical protein
MTVPAATGASNAVGAASAAITSATPSSPRVAARIVASSAWRVWFPGESVFLFT